jgi:putative ABC transport system permease protein
VRPIQEFVGAGLSRNRLTAIVLGGFAAAALLLAALGLYAVIASGVVERRREIAIRLALGGQRRQITALVMSQAVASTSVGLVIGVGVVLGLGPLFAGLLYGVSARDPATLFAATMFLAVIALAATYIPARSATRVEATLALRSE